MTKVAAHFVQWPMQFASPPNDALIQALLDLDYAVHVYATKPVADYADVHRYGSRVETSTFRYGRRWWFQNANALKWRRYRLFSGTTEDPMGVVGPLAKLTARPLVVMADEIFAGSYRGNASERWKRLCRWSMRQARFTIVNDESRVELQRAYAELGAGHRILVYPGCYRQPPPAGDRVAIREEYEIPENAWVIAYSGTFSWATGAGWIIRAMRQLPSDVYLMIQPAVIDVLTRALLDQLRVSHRLRVAPKHLTFEESWASMAAADMGFGLYLHDGPQFRNMGLASTKICMYLQTGLPVICDAQPSFAFIRDLKCGVLVHKEDDIPGAVQRIRMNHAAMSSSARRAIVERGRLAERYDQLVAALAAI